MTKVNFSAYILFAFITLGCATSKPKDLSKLKESNVRSIVIVPVVNNSTELSASEALLATLPKPIAEHGYYVFPVNMVKRVLEDDGISDSTLLHNADPVRVGQLFGADSILYATVESWTAKYMIITTEVEVKIHYVLKDTHRGEILWEEMRVQTYVPPNSGSGLGALISAAVSAAATKAHPNYIPLANMINADVFAYPGPGFLPGPYFKAKKY
jgi:hypothetical protein